MLVIGNGESRLGLNIDGYQRTKVGCNAIYRDHHVHHLICCDRRMVIEAQENNYKGTLYTRSDWVEQFKGVETVPHLPYKGNTRPDDPWHWGSGPYAVFVGARLPGRSKEVIHMIGFDLYPKEDGKINNIFKGTFNYNEEDSNGVNPSFWIYQIGKVMERFDSREFRIYNKADWKMPESWTP